MATLRATQFASGAIFTNATTTVYTVPAGHKIILKDITLQEASGVACVVNLRLASFGTFRAVTLAAFSGPGSFVELRCWMVFNPGDVLQMSRSNSNVYTYVLSGSLMTI